LWARTSAYTVANFRHHMKDLKRINGDAFNYLDKIDPSGWSREWFNDYPKCDLLVNNICERFNLYIWKACNKPILTILEMIRKKLIRRYWLKRNGIRALKDKLLPHNYGEA
jgi:hypothetical protein